MCCCLYVCLQGSKVKVYDGLDECTFDLPEKPVFVSFVLRMK